MNCKLCNQDFTQSYKQFPKVCMPCHRLRQANYRKTESGQAWIREHSRQRYQKYKTKYKARVKVTLAVETGKLIKPSICENCLAEFPLHAHHDNYEKPLDVMWLCDSCHKLRHGKLKDLTLIKGTGSKPL